MMSIIGTIRENIEKAIMKTRGYSKTVIGSREKNEDSFAVCDDLKIYAVADGVGGGFNGDIASNIAIDGIKGVSRNMSLKDKFLELQKMVLNESISSFGQALMGTTLTCLRFWDSEVELCHVGDSRCYLFDDHGLMLLTEDHEVFDDLYGSMVLSSYLGLDPDVSQLKIQEKRISLVSGMRFLLCSDGLYKQVPHDTISATIKQYFSLPQTLLDILCEEALKSVYSDNVTAIYVEVDE